MKFVENFEELRSRIKKNDIKEINSWDSYKKKEKNITIKAKIKTEIRVKKLKEKAFFIFIKNSYNVNNYIYKNKISIDYIGRKIFLYNFKNIKKTLLKKEWKMNKTIFIIIDLRHLKTKIIFFNKTKNLSFINNGLIFKKLQLKNKKYKKSDKLSFLALKAILNKMSLILHNKNIIIQTKGLKKNKNTLLKYISFFLDNKKNNCIFINNPKISSNKFFKFKKIKSIKRRLKKKIIKLK